MKIKEVRLKKCQLCHKYFEVNIDDAKSSLIAYRTNKPEDYEQLSIKQYARL